VGVFKDMKKEYMFLKKNKKCLVSLYAAMIFFIVMFVPMNIAIRTNLFVAHAEGDGGSEGAGIGAGDSGGGGFGGGSGGDNTSQGQNTSIVEFGDHTAVQTNPGTDSAGVGAGSTNNPSPTSDGGTGGAPASNQGTTPDAGVENPGIGVGSTNNNISENPGIGVGGTNINIGGVTTPSSNTVPDAGVENPGIGVGEPGAGCCGGGPEPKTPATPVTPAVTVPDAGVENPGIGVGEPGAGCCGGGPEPMTPATPVITVVPILEHLTLDVCPNIAGDQSVVPPGLLVDANGNCVPPAPAIIDVCPNIPGVQPDIPAGLQFDTNGNCTTPTVVVPPTDVCLNIPGVQTTVPVGMTVDVNGNCTTPTVVVPPTDVCLNIPGVQTTVPVGMTVDVNGNCTQPTVVDVCPNIIGNQAIPPAGYSIDGAGNCVPPSVCSIAPPVISSSQNVSATVGSPFSYTITTTGGTPTVTMQGTLPGGLTYNSITQIISGIPTVAGTFAIQILVNNPCGNDSKTILITSIGPTVCSITPPVITSAPTAGGVVGSPFLYTITTSGGTSTLTVVGTLPGGLTYNATSSIISGTPTTVETKNVTVTATNPCGNNTITLLVAVNPPGGGGCGNNCGGGGGGCGNNCGGGGGGGISTAPVFLFKVASSSPLAAGSIYLSQIPYTGFGDTALIVLFFMGLALFSYNMVMFMSKRKWATSGMASAVEYHKIYMAPSAEQITSQPQAPVVQSASASEIAKEMGTVLASILKDQAAQNVSVQAPQITAKEIAYEVSHAVSGAIEKQITSQPQAPVVQSASATEIAKETGNIIASILKDQATKNIVPQAVQATASEIAKETGLVLSSIIKEQVAQNIVAQVPQVSATEIAQKVGTVVSEIIEKHTLPQLKTVTEDKAPVTINVSIGNIHVGDNVTNTITTTNNNQLPPVEQPKVEVPKVETIVEAPVEVVTPIGNQKLVEALRELANDERILISPVGFDAIALEAKGDIDMAVNLMMKVVNEAKATYPRQHGWIELNKEKISNLLSAITV
jgi:hypothetical protein